MNIRKVALAIATASSVALAGTAVAGAEEAPAKDAKTSSQSSNKENTTPEKGAKTSDIKEKTSAGSKAIGDWLGADGELNADGIWGSDKALNSPAWGAMLWAGLAAGVIGTIASVVIGIGNYLKHEGIIR
ncbi:hypothetical protein [Corynebacterium resistens]|uniref:hypothetical protein n=1 Tax=Corynebacterium resistens TaxID=258224 RepID=UPI002355CAC0|nr:hypothetical protein [Corynebacterium resistens]